MAASGGQRSPFGFEEAFKEGRCIQGGTFFKKRTHRQTYYVLYNIDLTILLCGHDGMNLLEKKLTIFLPGFLTISPYGF